jgi:hypothetical protein
MGTPRGVLTKAVTNAVIANPYSRPNELSELLGKDARGVSNVLSKLYRAGVFGRKKCRYYFKGFKAQKQVKQLEINFDAPPQPVPTPPQPVAQPITHNQQLKIQALEKELYELKVQVLDQLAIIKYLEKKLESNE